jgi:hypothetical protein
MADKMEITVSAPLAALMAKGEAIVTDELRRGLEHGVTLLQAEVIRRHDRGVTGTLRTGVQTEVTGQRLDLAGRVFSTASYALPVEEGGRPHRAPLAPLLAWARRVGASNPQRLARAVWWSIAKRGTKAQPRWRPSFLARAAAVKARFDQMLRDIDRRFGGGG